MNTEKKITQQQKKAIKLIQWNGSKGKQPLLPKDLGVSYHISGFTNAQAGWNPLPPGERLVQINNNRHGKNYLAREEAIKLYGTAKKHDLKMDKLEAFI